MFSFSPFKRELNFSSTDNEAGSLDTNYHVIESGTLMPEKLNSMISITIYRHNEYSFESWFMVIWGAIIKEGSGRDI